MHTFLCIGNIELSKKCTREGGKDGVDSSLMETNNKYLGFQQITYPRAICDDDRLPGGPQKPCQKVDGSFGNTDKQTMGKSFRGEVC